MFEMVSIPLALAELLEVEDFTGRSRAGQRYSRRAHPRTGAKRDGLLEVYEVG
jgi:hypothetical protein